MNKIIGICLVVFTLLLSGCYKQIIEINNDAVSGKITYEISYYNDFDNLLRYLHDNKGLDLRTLIFFNKTRLESEVRKQRGLNLLSHTIDKQNVLTQSKVILLLDDLAALYDFLPTDYFTFSLKSDMRGNTGKMIFDLSKFEQYTGFYSMYTSLTDEEKRLFDTYLSLIQFEFIFSVDGVISKTNKGRILEDSNSVAFTFSLHEYLQKNKKLELTFLYK